MADPYIQLFTLGLVISENYCVTKGGVGQDSLDVGLDQLLFSIKVKLFHPSLN